MRKPILQTAEFSDLFDEYKILTDKERVRKNSRDDFGLGRGWYYSGGSRVDGEWTSCWTKPKADFAKLVENQCCEGRIGAFEWVRWQDKSLHLFANDILMISRPHCVFDVSGVPEDVLSLVLWAFKY